MAELFNKIKIFILYLKNKSKPQDCITKVKTINYVDNLTYSIKTMKKTKYKIYKYLTIANNESNTTGQIRLCNSFKSFCKFVSCFDVVCKTNIELPYFDNDLNVYDLPFATLKYISVGNKNIKSYMNVYAEHDTEKTKPLNYVYVRSNKNEIKIYTKNIMIGQKYVLMNEYNCCNKSTYTEIKVKVMTTFPGIIKIPFDNDIKKLSSISIVSIDIFNINLYNTFIEFQDKVIILRNSKLKPNSIYEVVLIVAVVYSLINIETIVTNDYYIKFFLDDCYTNIYPNKSLLLCGHNINMSISLQQHKYYVNIFDYIIKNLLELEKIYVGISVLLRTKTKLASIMQYLYIECVYTNDKKNIMYLYLDSFILKLNSLIEELSAWLLFIDFLPISYLERILHPNLLVTLINNNILGTSQGTLENAIKKTAIKSIEETINSLSLLVDFANILNKFVNEHEYVYFNYENNDINKSKARQKFIKINTIPIKLLLDFDIVSLMHKWTKQIFLWFITELGFLSNPDLFYLVNSCTQTLLYNYKQIRNVKHNCVCEYIFLYEHVSYLKKGLSPMYFNNCSIRLWKINSPYTEIWVDCMFKISKQGFYFFLVSGTVINIAKSVINNIEIIDDQQIYQDKRQAMLMNTKMTERVLEQTTAHIDDKYIFMMGTVEPYTNNRKMQYMADKIIVHNPLLIILTCNEAKNLYEQKYNFGIDDVRTNNNLQFNKLQCDSGQIYHNVHLENDYVMNHVIKNDYNINNHRIANINFNTIANDAEGISNSFIYCNIYDQMKLGNYRCNQSFDFITITKSCKLQNDEFINTKLNYIPVDNCNNNASELAACFAENRLPYKLITSNNELNLLAYNDCEISNQQSMVLIYVGPTNFTGHALFFNNLSKLVYNGVINDGYRDEGTVYIYNTDTIEWEIKGKFKSSDSYVHIKRKNVMYNNNKLIIPIEYKGPIEEFPIEPLMQIEIKKIFNKTLMNNIILKNEFEQHVFDLYTDLRFIHKNNCLWVNIEKLVLCLSLVNSYILNTTLSVAKNNLILKFFFTICPWALDSKILNYCIHGIWKFIPLSLLSANYLSLTYSSQATSFFNSSIMDLLNTLRDNANSLNNGSFMNKLFEDSDHYTELNSEIYTLCPTIIDCLFLFNHSRYTIFDKVYKPCSLLSVATNHVSFLFNMNGKKVVYQGVIVQNLFEGKGKITQCNTDMILFDGNWLAGQPHGYCNFALYENDQQYRGTMFKNSRYGVGTLFNIVSKKILYSGYWYNDLPHIRGTKYYSNCYYKGEFFNGQMNGFGVLHSDETNASYIGNWKNNMPNGDCLILKDGTVKYILKTSMGIIDGQFRKKYRIKTKHVLQLVNPHKIIFYNFSRIKLFQPDKAIFEEIEIAIRAFNTSTN